MTGSEVIHLNEKRAFRRSDQFGVPIRAAREIAPGLSCRLRRSTQHLPAVYSPESEILRSFSGVGSSAARPGRAALERWGTGRFLEGSIAATADWCSRSCRAAKDSADRRSRPAHL